MFQIYSIIILLVEFVFRVENVENVEYYVLTYDSIITLN